jgi:hypothetical protein
VLTCGLELILGILGTTLEVVFPACLPFLKRILEVMFCGDVQQHVWFCLDHVNRVKMAAFQFSLNRGTRKIGWVGGRQSCCFRQKNSLLKKEVWDGVLSWCNSQLFCRQSLRPHLHTVAKRRRSSMPNWLFCLPGRILCELYPWYQRNLWACSSYV